MDGAVESIDDADIVAALRRRARRIHVQAAVSGVLYGALCVALATG